MSAFSSNCEGTKRGLRQSNVAVSLPTKTMNSKTVTFVKIDCSISSGVASSLIYERKWGTVAVVCTSSDRCSVPIQLCWQYVVLLWLWLLLPLPCVVNGLRWIYESVWYCRYVLVCACATKCFAFFFSETSLSMTLYFGRFNTTSINNAPTLQKQ